MVALGAMSIAGSMMSCYVATSVLVFSQPLTPFHRNLSLLFSASHKFPTLRPLAFAKEENTLVLNKDERFGGWRTGEVFGPVSRKRRKGARWWPNSHVVEYGEVLDSHGDVIDEVTSLSVLLSMVVSIFLKLGM
ncbi:tRNA modification GTPase MnmE [Salvia divinorum]|uniref:tRNA modification GTPase MnmE n=1 Tax=Salvia divinorum TaxID=28513 RepID=A0ABD1G8U0_SALDI